LAISVSRVTSRQHFPSDAPFVGSFALRSELLPFYQDWCIGDRFCSQTSGFGEMLVVSSQTEEVEPSSTSKLIRVLNLNLLLRLKFKIQRELDLAGTGFRQRVA